MLLLCCLAATVAAPLRIVATTPDLAAVAVEVAGPLARVTAMSLPTQDPHFVDPKPSLALELARADALLVQGMELEIGWLPTLVSGSRNPAIQNGSRGYLDCSRFVAPLQVPAGTVDRSMGDIHPSGNPHYTMDPRAMAAVAQGMGYHFGQIDPANAAKYAENASDFARRVQARRADWEAAAAPLRGTAVIDYHRSWPYLEDWLGFSIIADIEPKPGIPPTPKHVVHVLQIAQEHHATLVLQESWFPTRTAEEVAERIGGRLVVLPGQTDFPGGETWIEHVDEIVAALTAPPGTAEDVIE